MKYQLKSSAPLTNESFQLGVSWRENGGNQACNPFWEESDDYIDFLAGFWSENQTTRYREKKSIDKIGRLD